MYSSRIVLNQNQIEAINWRNLQKKETGLAELTDIEMTIASKQVEMKFGLEKLCQEPRYNRHGICYGEAFYNSLTRKICASLPSGTITLQRAVAVQNGLIRAYPTMAGSYREHEIGELDRFAVSILKLGEPVLLYCTDSTGLWCFVQATQLCGWVLRDILALEPDEYRWQQYCCNCEYAIVADSRRRIDYTDANGIHRVQTLWMGTRLPLYDAAPDVFLLGIPIKDKQGNLAVMQIRTKRDGGLIPGNMPLSAQNIISQAKKMLGEPYGWGGAEFRRDCTSLVADVYAVFGFTLPRNSREQMKMHGIEHCPKEKTKKEAFLSCLMPGSILYCPGHAMLYLGKDSGQMQMLHSTYAIGLPAKERLILHKIRRVVQGTLSQHRVTGETFFDAVEAVWAPDHQKDFLLR